MKAPFPWFGGKSKVAQLVWDRFGDVQNYVEPFFGSGAVLLDRPTPAGTETINDLDCLVANFWRALKMEPESVAEWADNPVNEADQHARHLWLVSRAEFRERMKTDPDYYDTKIAGWWVWGQCIWIGSGWCAKKAERVDGTPWRLLPHLGNAGTGVHRKLPHLGDAGKGLNRQLPHLGDAGTGDSSDPTSGTRRGQLVEYMRELAERLRSVRVCCGDWKRVCGPSVTVKHGVTGIFLDPPYSDAAGRQDDLYATDSGSVAVDVLTWAIEAGEDPRARVALCGYDGEHVLPDTWECVEWKARGGYGSQGETTGRDNAGRERIWFSPHCLKQRGLFDLTDSAAPRAADC